MWNLVPHYNFYIAKTKSLIDSTENLSSHLVYYVRIGLNCRMWILWYYSRILVCNYGVRYKCDLQSKWVNDCAALRPVLSCPGLTSLPGRQHARNKRKSVWLDPLLYSSLFSVVLADRERDKGAKIVTLRGQEWRQEWTSLLTRPCIVL